MSRRGSISCGTKISMTSKRVDPANNPETARIINSLPFTINGYQLSEVIGTGSYAVVFRAHHNGYKLDFAAKMISTKQSWATNGDFECESEINALKQLYHQNIIKLYDSFTYKNHLFLILQLCEAGTLKKLIAPNIGMPQKQLIQFMHQLLSALSYSHSHHIAHRDIKTANIFLDSHNRPLLADFGFANFLNQDEQVNNFFGAIIYRSPEIIRQEPHDPFKADVWALGVTFYIMACGTEPWPTYSQSLVRETILAGTFEIPETVDIQIAEIIRAMLIVDPTSRPSVDDILNLPFFSDKKNINKSISTGSIGALMNKITTKNPNCCLTRTAYRITHDKKIKDNMYLKRSKHQNGRTLFTLHAHTCNQGFEAKSLDSITEEKE